MALIDFESSDIYQQAKRDYGGHATDYDFGERNWQVFEGGLLPHPVEGNLGIDSQLLTELFHPSLRISVDAFRHLDNLDHPGRFIETQKHRRRGFTVSRLQVVLHAAQKQTISERQKWRRVRRVIELPNMMRRHSDGNYHQDRVHEEENLDPRIDPDIVLRLPTQRRQRVFPVEVPDLYVLYLRKFHGFDNNFSFPDDPDALVKASRVDHGRWFDPQRVVADLKFLTAKEPGLQRPSAVEDLHQGSYSGSGGGNYGSYDSEIARSLAGFLGDVAYWVTVDLAANGVRKLLDRSHD